MPPDSSNNKNTIRMITANHDNAIHASTQLDLQSFRNRDTLLDITIASFGADKVQAPYIESVFEGVKTVGHEVKKIGDLVKVYDKKENPDSEKDGFQAYFVVVSNGQTEKAGLPLEIKDGQREFLSADGTTVEKLKEIIDKLPDGAELVVVWRRDVEKTKDVTYVDSSSAVALSNNSNFQMPKCFGCAANGKDVKLDDGLYLFTDRGEDRITFSSSIVTQLVSNEYLGWDGGIFPTGLLNQVPSFSGINQQAQFAYLAGISTDISGKLSPGPNIGGTISMQSESPINQTNQKVDRVDTMPTVSYKFMPEESIIIRLLMNPAERKIWGKLYGLVDEDEARVMVDAPGFRQKIISNNQETRSEDFKSTTYSLKGHDDSSKGFIMSNNEIEFEKSESASPSKLMFSTLLEKVEDKVEEIEDDKNDPDRFRMKVIIGEVSKVKRKKKIDEKNAQKKHKKQGPPGLTGPLRPAQRKIESKAKPKKRISNVREVTKLATPKKSKTQVLPKAKTSKSKNPINKIDSRHTMKTEKKKDDRKKAIIGKKDTIFLGASPFNIIHRPKVEIRQKKRSGPSKDYKLLWMLDKNKSWNKFKNVRKKK